MAFWLVYETDGSFHQIISDEKPDGDSIQVLRHTLDPHCEHFDRVKGKWIKDHNKRADIDQEIKLLTTPISDIYKELLTKISLLELRIKKLEEK